MHAFRKFLLALTLAVGCLSTASPQPTYHPPSLGDFDGSSDYLWRSSMSVVNGKIGIVSMWLRIDGIDGQIIRPVNNASNRMAVFRRADNKLNVFARNSSGGTIMSQISTTTHLSGEGWFHLLASWDLGASEFWMYIDDVDADAAGGTLLNQNIDYTQTAWAVAAATSGSQPWDGAIAVLYLNITQKLDLSVVANRRKFIDASGYPVDLGATCYLPTGAVPIMCMKTQYNNGGENSGTGGDFGIVGAPTYTPGPVPLLPLIGGGGPGARGARGGLIR